MDALFVEASPNVCGLEAEVPKKNNLCAVGVRGIGGPIANDEPAGNQEVKQIVEFAAIRTGEQSNQIDTGHAGRLQAGQHFFENVEDTDTGQTNLATATTQNNTIADFDNLDWQDAKGCCVATNGAAIRH